MRSWKVIALSVLALAAATSDAAQKKHATHAAAAPAPTEEAQSQPAASSGSSMGYGVRLGGFFTDQNKQTARKSFAQHFAKTKECPKDMERQGKTCRALVQGHYWAVGQPLQSKVETFPVPEDVEARLPKPPQGYEYVRAGEDILLMSKGLHLVVDMIEDAVS